LKQQRRAFAEDGISRHAIRMIALTSVKRRHEPVQLSGSGSVSLSQESLAYSLPPLE